ncbi:LL-diaminopimelate aminotransferase [Mesobacillus harenae]|uniref:LL-diaminopimelate aminotransferase n=1 Tax=Mesobacillus harenae TaxID=2213203 RepID=UPI001580F768|nr:LL-diaminopimelate aminotransferase [Mesobacillus harenae]
MSFTTSRRMKAFEQSIFAELSQLKKMRIAEGEKIIDLSIGSPDLPPPKFLMDAISKDALNPAAYGYSLTGTEEFQESVRTYYKKNHNVSLNTKNEIIQLMGSQDGLVHFPMVLCNPGDYILVPDPGYTAYATGASMSGAELYPMPSRKETGFLPELNNIPEDILHKAKLMILNFPGNPVPAMVTRKYFEEAIAVAKKYKIVILHDFAYSELYYGEKPLSFLAVEGAKDVGIEMNSLSKSFNMAGCRVAYAAGNPDLIEKLAQLKSNLDYGVFLPVQNAAAKALIAESNFLQSNREIYKARRDVLISGLEQIGWHVDIPQASMFIWAEIPQGFSSSKEFSIELLHKANVVVTPGNAFGRYGEGYVRIALVQPEAELLKAVKSIADSSLFNKKASDRRRI